MLSCFSHVQLFATLWNVAFQAPLCMGLSRQAYWSGLPFLPPGDLPGPGIKPVSLMSPALAGGFFTTSPTWEVFVGLSMMLFGTIKAPGWGAEEPGLWDCKKHKVLPGDEPSDG